VIRRKIAGGLPVSQIWSRSAEVRDRELSKCQVLCAPCHKMKSNDEQRTTQHGATMYGRGCRCSFCKETMIMYWRKQREIKKQKLASVAEMD
jgi:hypothetical protein